MELELVTVDAVEVEVVASVDLLEETGVVLVEREVVVVSDDMLAA